MKKALLIAMAALFVASSVFALPPKGYIGVFNSNPAILGTPPDYPNAGNSVCPGPYTAFHVWIWAVPSERNLQAAEFAVLFPGFVITTVTTKNPLITAELGSLGAGISVSFGTCQTDWVWIYDLTCMVIQMPPFTGRIDIINHPGTIPAPAMQFVNCQMLIEPFTYLTPLYVCPVDHPLGVEPSNWGAIKSLF